MRVGSIEKPGGEEEKELLDRAMYEWQLEMAKFYYYLGIVGSQQVTKELGLASLLKSLAIIKDLYLFHQKINTEENIKNQIGELLLIC